VGSAHMRYRHNLRGKDHYIGLSLLRLDYVAI